MEFQIKPFDIGPIMGDTSTDSVRLWGRAKPVRTEEGLQRCFGAARVMRAGQLVGGPQFFKMNPAFDMTGVTVFQGLDANTKYEYQIGCFASDLDFDDLAAGHQFNWTEAHTSAFTTAAAGESEERSFVFGSCRYLLKIFGATLWDKRGDRTFRSVLKQIEGKDEDEPRPVDFTLMLGDQIYADDLNFLLPDSTVDQYFERYRDVFAQTHVRELMGKVPTYMTLDDHEIEDNWPQRATSQDVLRKFPAAMQAFQAYQLSHGPLYDVRPDGRIDGSPDDYWYEFRNGCCDVFVTDSRTERFYPEEGDVRLIFSEEQIEALKNWLAAEADGRVKLVATSVPFFPDLAGGRDRWDGFPDQRNEILDFIQANQIRKVVFLSGDVHSSMSAELVDADDPSFKVVSIVSSPFFWPYPHSKASRFQLSGYLKHANRRYQIGNARPLVSKDNFTRVTVRPDEVTVEVFGRKGAPLGETKHHAL